ncbi:Phosphoglycerate kinase [hydrothermal vent metagenome]|uniref:phosphoglycerate kinase n=1 Tax=hydrothermal vent metagenome TaxID=652676 RepID=A0A3B1BPG7_9ZZZZ
MAHYKNIADLGALDGKRVLIRADLNVPMGKDKDGNSYVTDDTRIRSVAPTILHLMDKGARVIVMSHFGRPKGKVQPEMSLEQLAQPLSNALKKAVVFVNDCTGDIVAETLEAMEDDAVLLLENLRFHPGETANDPEFAKALAANADFYVNEAFSCSHRAHASTEGIAHLLPSAAGLSLEKELTALETALGNPQRPLCAVVGGAKVSSKLDVLTNLVEKVDHLIIGGGMANTFLAAEGVNVGNSLCEHDLADTARAILAKAVKQNCAIHLPTDLVVAREFRAGAENRVIPLEGVAYDDMILDVGPATVAGLAKMLKSCKTLIWNGPMGAFEIAPFDAATVALAKAAGKLTAEGAMVSVAGGGDTVAALNHAGVAGQFSHISTAGGAFLEWMEGKELPGIKILEK